MNSSKPVSMIFQGKQQRVVMLALSYGYRTGGVHSGDDAARLQVYGHNLNGEELIVDRELKTLEGYTGNSYCGCVIDNIFNNDCYAFVSWKVERGKSDFIKLFSEPQFIFDIQDIPDITGNTVLVDTE